MNSLPHISHHLFAAALATEDSPARRPERRSAPRTVPGLATALPLELLSEAEETPPRVARPLRPALVAVGT